MVEEDVHTWSFNVLSIISLFVGAVFLRKFLHKSEIFRALRINEYS